jgi:hypothetical protein
MVIILDDPLRTFWVNQVYTPPTPGVSSNVFIPKELMVNFAKRFDSIVVSGG